MRAVSLLLPGAACEPFRRSWLVHPSSQLPPRRRKLASLSSPTNPTVTVWTNVWPGATNAARTLHTLIVNHEILHRPHPIVASTPTKSRDRYQKIPQAAPMAAAANTLPLPVNAEPGIAATGLPPKRRDAARRSGYVRRPRRRHRTTSLAELQMAAYA
jgi:hypothetical protein